MLTSGAPLIGKTSHITTTLTWDKQFTGILMYQTFICHLTWEGATFSRQLSWVTNLEIQA